MMNSGWLKEKLLWSFRIGNQHRLLQMPNRTITDFDYSVKRLRFLPDAQLFRDLPAIPRSSGHSAVSCTSMRTIRAYSPAAAGRSMQRRDPSSESDDDATSEDTD
ncbi:hypothetical protein F2Q69_00028571 [Brassica cretica]|uniref:Uncharacterized protein n=1 Tax=Brassica cretica TaxID=69181 RepID=A0A8S9S3M8_BRACR|nr:hypothetical protein F2Q69_00028571 [Brassica cretica]